MWVDLPDTEILTKGWPDFLVRNTRSGKLLCIEVKQPGEKLKPHQQAMKDALESAGIDVLVVESDGRGSYLRILLANLRARRDELLAAQPVGEA